MDDETYVDSALGAARERLAMLPSASPEADLARAELAEWLIIRAGRISQIPGDVTQALAEPLALLGKLWGSDGEQAVMAAGRRRRLRLLTGQADLVLLEATGDGALWQRIVEQLEEVVRPVGGGCGAGDGGGTEDASWWQHSDTVGAQVLLAQVVWERATDDRAEETLSRRDLDRVITLLAPVVGGPDIAHLDHVPIHRARLGLALFHRSWQWDQGSAEAQADRGQAAAQLRAVIADGESGADLRDAVAFELAHMLFVLQDDLREALALLGPLSRVPDESAAAPLELGAVMASALYADEARPETLREVIDWYRRKVGHRATDREALPDSLLELATYLQERSELPGSQRRSDDPPPEDDRAEAVERLEHALLELSSRAAADPAFVQQIIVFEVYVLFADLETGLPPGKLDLLIERGQEVLRVIDDEEPDRPDTVLKVGLALSRRLHDKAQPHLYALASQAFLDGVPDPQLAMARLDPTLDADSTESMRLLEVALGLYGYEDERYLAAAAGLGNACLLHFFIHLPDFRGRALAEGIRRIRVLLDRLTPEGPLTPTDFAGLLIPALVHSIWASAPFRAAREDGGSGAPGVPGIPDTTGYPVVEDELRLLEGLLDTAGAEIEPVYVLMSLLIVAIQHRGAPDASAGRLRPALLRNAADRVGPQEWALRAMLLAFAGALGLEAARTGAGTPADRADALEALRESLTFLPEGNAFRGVVEDAVRSGMRDGLLWRLFGASGWGGVRPAPDEGLAPHQERTSPQPPPAPPSGSPSSAPRWAEGDDPEGGDIDMAAAVLLGDGAPSPFAVPVGRLIEIVGPAAGRSAVAAMLLALARHTRWLHERDGADLTAAVGLVRDAVGELRDRAPAPGREAGRGGDRATGQQDGRLADRCELALAGLLLDRHLLLGDHADLAAAHDIHERLLRTATGRETTVSDLPALLIRAADPTLLPQIGALFLQDRPAPASFRAELLAAAGRTGLLRARARPADSAHDGGERTAAVARLRAAADLLPAGHPVRPAVRGDLGLDALTRGLDSGDEATLRDAVEEMLSAAAECPQDSAHRSGLLLRAAGALRAHDRHTVGASRLDEGIVLLGSAAEAPHHRFHGSRARCQYGLGELLVARHLRTGDSDDLRRAVSVLKAARESLESGPGDPFTAILTRALARAYRAGGRDDEDARRKSRDTGRFVLAAHARAVLLQSGTHRGLVAAGAVGPDMLRLVTWCLEDDRPEEAVQALELGRGLVLHAATVGGTVPQLLREAKQPGLAQEWTAQVERAGRGGATGQGGAAGEGARAGQPAPVEVPDDLRRRVLEALKGEPAEIRLLSAPSPEEIGRALTAMGRDALIHLVPARPGAGSDRPGHALVVASTGAVRTLPLPGLTVSADSPLGEHLRAADAFRAAGRNRPPETDVAFDPWIRHRYDSERRWQRSLDALCAWAGDVVMTTLIDHARVWWPDRTPRLVLMPVGALGTVPWHAAAVPATSARPGADRACGSVAISYCAAARQLVDVAQRPRLAPSDSQLLLTDPGGHPAVHEEVALLHDLYYPAATVIGADVRVPVEPARVAAYLPGGGPSSCGLVHVNCHATSAASAADSGIELDPDMGLRLTVDDLLTDGHGGAPDVPGGTVLLANCTSDLTLGDYDEALTLATAFLAAGATSVVGSRWEVVDDDRMKLFMCVFHHFLTGGGTGAGTAGSPADALRAAQLWMLDPWRAVPPGLEELASSVAAETARRRGRRPLDELEIWSAFAHHGH